MVGGGDESKKFSWLLWNVAWSGFVSTQTLGFRAECSRFKMPTSSQEKHNVAGLCFPPQPGPCSLKELALQGGQACNALSASQACRSLDAGEGGISISHS